jgi:hypothetical protein
VAKDNRETARKVDSADNAERRTPNADGPDNADRPESGEADNADSPKRRTRNANRQDAATRWRLRFVVVADQQLRGRLCG